MKKLALLLAAIPLIAACADTPTSVAPRGTAAPRNAVSAVNFTVYGETYATYGNSPVQYDSWQAGGEIVVGQTLNGNNTQLGTVSGGYGIGSFTQAASGTAHLLAYPYSGCTFLYFEINGVRVYDDYIDVDDYPSSGSSAYDYNAYFQCHYA
jgi:hypothetical protein